MARFPFSLQDLKKPRTCTISVPPPPQQTGSSTPQQQFSPTLLPSGAFCPLLLEGFPFKAQSKKGCHFSPWKSTGHLSPYQETQVASRVAFVQVGHSSGDTWAGTLAQVLRNSGAGGPTHFCRVLKIHLLAALEQFPPFGFWNLQKWRSFQRKTTMEQRKARRGNPAVE